MKFYFDVTATTTKTIAVEAEYLEQAKMRAENAWHREEFEIDSSLPDAVEIKSAQAEVENCIKCGDLAEEELETFDCHKPVFNEKQQMFVCPVCNEPIADWWAFKDVGFVLPSRCSRCHTALK